MCILYYTTLHYTDYTITCYKLTYYSIRRRRGSAHLHPARPGRRRLQAGPLLRPHRVAAAAGQGHVLGLQPGGRIYELYIMLHYIMIVYIIVYYDIVYYIILHYSIV